MRNYPIVKSIRSIISVLYLTRNNEKKKANNANKISSPLDKKYDAIHFSINLIIIIV